MKFGRAVCLVVCLAGRSLIAAEDLYEIKTVAEDVYAAIARPHRPENANSAFVILAKGVLVVDAASTPSSARGLIEQIRKLTSKPVQYLVNTHFHWDHFWGNQAFAEAFPRLEVMASESTREDMERMGLGAMWAKRLTDVELPQAFEEWNKQLTKEPDPQRRQALRERMEAWRRAGEELQAVHFVFPTMTFDRRLGVYDASQPVEVLWLGRGHTSGDVVVYLPKARVLISGDLVAGDTPYIADISPCEWIKTLDALERLDFDTIIPGHGDVMHGKDGLRLWRDYFRELTSQTESAYAAGLTMEDTVKQVSARLTEKFNDRFPPEFPRAVGGNVRATYRFVSGQQE